LQAQAQGADLTNQAREQALTKEQAQFMLTDAATDAIQIKELAKADPMRAQVAIAQRIKKIIDRGGDPSDTIAVRDALQSGNVDLFNSELDTVISAAQQRGLLGVDPGKLTMDQVLRTKELDIKNRRLEFDQTQAEQRIQQLDQAVNKLDLPQADKDVIKSMSPDAQEKLLGQLMSPKERKDQAKLQKEAAQAKQGAQEVYDLALELKNHPGRKSAVGFSSILPSRPGGDAKNFEIKLERLSNLLTVDNLDKMSGVLSESDIKILKSAAAGLDIGQSEEAFSGELDRIINKMSEKLGIEAPANTDQNSVGRFKVRVK